MNYAAALPAEFFDQQGLPKIYNLPLVQQQIGSMNILRKAQTPSPNDAILISEEGEEIQLIQQSNGPSVPGSVMSSAAGSVPPPDFPFIEFLFMEVVNQSQIDFSSISDALHPRETSISLSSSSYNPDFQGKSQESAASDEEMRETRDLTISVKPSQSTRDSSTISISNNSTLRKSISGTKNSNPTSFPVETDISFIADLQLSNNSSVMPTDAQALTVLQDLVSGDFQVKNTHSTFLKEREDDTTFSLIQEVQRKFQRLHSLHKYRN